MVSGRGSSFTGDPGGGGRGKGALEGAALFIRALYGNMEGGFFVEALKVFKGRLWE